ncbi:hypothetical protein Gogos_021862 [Gossypium gossypioides]|uniref:Uncharacterized protein n=1 Tax=Gossypium gossypioides TaxID=34282 RepID=A0A7J9D3G7_GOSGO|nr:hypothetical protein [Gossypium gossypioides]
MEMKPLMVQNPSMFLNTNVENNFSEFQGKTFIQERQIDPSTILCKKICPLVRYHRWERFWTISEDNVVVPTVQEFYTSLRDNESRITEGQIDKRLEQVTTRNDNYTYFIKKEFARKNNIQVPNYTPDMFGLTNMKQEEEVPEREEEGEKEEDDGDMEMDDEEDD